jgi:hypothetical protein
MFGLRLFTLLVLIGAVSVSSLAQSRWETTLSNAARPFSRPGKPYVVLKRAEIEAVVVDNSAVNDEVLPDHRAGYSGLAILRHARQPENLFVPRYAGLNFEHILDGVAPMDRQAQFEPRNHPMEIRVISQYAAELCQTPTFHNALESCQRYELLEDGTVQLTIEVIPRKEVFPNGYLNLFWASYIHQPESLDIRFRGLPAGAPEGTAPSWIRGVTPSHGVLSTHPAVEDRRVFVHDHPFPLTLVFSLSGHRYSEPWYYGISHGMAFVQMFRPQDGVRLTQSPSGGGQGNPAWDFQFFVENPQAGKLYRFVMRAAYLPFESPEQIEQATRMHREALAAEP